MAIASMLPKSRNCVLHLRVHLGITQLQPQPPDLRHIVFLLDLGALKAGENWASSRMARTAAFSSGTAGGYDRRSPFGAS